MTLIKCPECGKEISEYAETCTNCGISRKTIIRHKRVEEEKKRVEKIRHMKLDQKEENIVSKIKEYLDIYGILSLPNLMSLEKLKCLNEKIEMDFDKEKLKFILEYCVMNEILSMISVGRENYPELIGSEIYGEVTFYKSDFYYLPNKKIENVITKRLNAPKIAETWDLEYIEFYLNHEEFRTNILNLLNDKKVLTYCTVGHDAIFSSFETTKNIDDSTVFHKLMRAAVWNGDCICKMKKYYCLPTLSEDEFEFYKSQCDIVREQETAEKIRKAVNEMRLEREAKVALSNELKCPICESTNISKISQARRALSVGLFGMASSNIGKTKKCNNCGYKW